VPSLRGQPGLGAAHAGTLRRVLVAMMGGGVLSPGSLVKMLLGGRTNRERVLLRESVMKQEEAERIRRGEILFPNQGRGPGVARPGRRLRAHLRAN